jgi:hypothetical protein
VADLMLGSLSSHGLTGLALWPEDLRHPATVLDCVDPLVAPEQFAGLTVRVAPSGISYDLFETLGATPVFDEWDGCTIQATESGLQQGQSLPGGVTFTGDVTLFPKFQVLAAEAAAFGRLSNGQRQAIADAAVEARRAAVAARVSDVQAGDEWCAHGGRVVLAGPDGVAAFQAAATPVFERLAVDPVTAEAIEAITSLKATIDSAPGPVACGVDPGSGGPISAATGPTPIDGTYVTHVSLEELSTSPLLYDRGEVNDGNWGDITFTFDAGVFTQTLKNPNEQHVASGTYAVDEDLLTIHYPATWSNEPFSYRWRLEGDQLILTRDPDLVGPTPFLINPWTRVAGATVSEDPVTPPQGTWRIDVTREAMETAGLPDGVVDDVAGLYTWTFPGEGSERSGTFTLAAQSPRWGSFTCDGEFGIHDDGTMLMRYLTYPNCGGGKMLWRWSVDADGNGHVQVLDTPGYDVQVDRLMWASAPFVRID